MLNILLLVIFQVFHLCYAKYNINDELQGIGTIGAADWMDINTNEYLNLCLKNDKLIAFGKQQSSTAINWEKTYSLPNTLLIYIYIEYQVSGNWNNKLDLYVNDIMTYSQQITLTDTNRLCSETFLYNDYIYVQLSIPFNSLKLSIKADAIGLGLYIQNIVINQRTQSGRDIIIPYFFDSIPVCPVGLEFNQYYCSCPSWTYLQDNTCVPVCGAGYLFVNTVDQVGCIKKNYCDTCVGQTGSFKCNDGYIQLITYDVSGVPNTDCVVQCPRNYKVVDRTTYKECLELASYIKEFVNNNNLVDRYQFYQSNANFLHFFSQLNVKVAISSDPIMQKERPFFFFNNKFIVGTYEKFKIQTIALSTLVGNSQYQLRLKGIAHFIDFQPTQHIVQVNRIELDSTGMVVTPSNQNEGTDLQDYICEYDLTWTTPEKKHIYSNYITIQVQQPLQEGEYKGYFYIEDIQIYSLNCRAECGSCLDLDSCDNCSHPAHKDPDYCNCETGYFLNNDDICVLCPSYCSECQIDNVCVSCKESTKRITPPNCKTCPSKYYLLTGQDNCQSCIEGCDKCTTADLCVTCLAGYFLHQSEICVIQCDKGYFNNNSDPSKPICSLCDTNCLECEDLATKCTVCKENFMLVSDACYKCDDGTYLSGTDCLPCPDHCKYCTITNCRECDDSYFYHSGRNQCVSTCDSNQFSNTVTRTCDACNATCQTCAGGTTKDCLSCPLGLYLNFLTSVSGECSPNCAPGYYISGINCAKCWVGCKTCADGTQKCLICAPLYYRYKDENKCVLQCPDGYYNNPKGYVCSPCDPSCKTCSGFSAQNCNSCILPLALYEYQCLETCPLGYGNVNAVCEKCTANCDQCFGKAPNQCSTCSTGFYFLNNQCYGKCPKDYFGVRPQYKCKCVFDNCVSCLDGQFNYNNSCQDTCPHGTYGFNGICIKCDLSCQSCFGEEFNNCQTCVTPLVLFENTCLIECQEGTFLDVRQNECFYCDDSCLVCSGPTINDCTSCKNSQLLSTDGSCVDVCPEGSYIVISEMKCYACDSTCKTCFGGAGNSCLTCPTASLFYMNECVDSCPDGFRLSTSGLACETDADTRLAICSYQCSKCQFTERFCTECSGNRVQNAPFCECEQGSYDDGSNSQCLPCVNKCLTCKLAADKCQLCKGNRFLPNCSCPQYYYDDGTSVQCIKCQDNCATCDQTGCLTCLHDRINAPDCVCPAKYYEAFKPYCQTCGEQCSTCAESDSLCITCAEGRIDPPICNCPPGFFSTQDKQCQKCNPTCSQCHENDCLACSGNRKGPILGQCICESPGVSRMSVGSVYCTDCDIGVPYFGLNDDFTGFSIDFGAMVELINKKNDPICNVIFKPETLLLLGKDPICETDLTVLFGENPTIKVGDEIKLNTQFRLVGCDSQFSSILVLALSIPQNIDQNTHKPLVVFNELIDKNVCAPIKIDFVEKKYNGGQILKVIEWSIISPSNPNPQILQILQENQANNSEVIRFPEKIFDADTKYKFQVKLESFAFLQNTIQVEFTPIVRFEVFLQVETTKNQYYRYEQIRIPFQLIYSNCIEQSQPPNLLSYTIQFQNNNDTFLNEKLTQGLTKGFVKDLEINIDPYYFNLTNPNPIIYKTSLVRFDYSLTKNGTFDLYIVSSDPKITIDGSSRMIGYEDKLELGATIKDLDFSPKEAEEMVYVCFWECINIANGFACRDVSDQLIEFNNKCNLTIQPKTLAPYNVFEFSVSIFKKEVKFTTKVNIQTMEVGLPALDVSPVNQNQLYNYYDEHILKLTYPGVNPDFLMYAGAVIYNQIAVSTFEFYYLDFKFKLQDYFTDLSLEYGFDIRLRLSIYDPHFVMPSVSTVILPMNIPPQKCELQYNKGMVIEFLDKLNINVINCEDLNMPLSYEVYLYANQTIYQQDLVKARFYHNLLLIPPQQSASFDISLTYYSQEQNLLVILIKDSIGGIQNITTTIPVRRFNEINEDTFRNYMNQQNNLDYQLIAQRIIVERLSLMGDLINYKEELYKKLIKMDQNQTFLSNQTECLYHSISMMVGQNCSLLQFNQTEFINQLNYRINQTAKELINLSKLQMSSQLTSELNIQKTNYIQQYCSFANILSQFVKFRVTVNQTSTEIQNSLNSIMEYLQSISIPNEPLFTIQSNSANMNFGYLTSKMVKSITSTSLSSEEKSQNQTNTNFYKFSQTRFIDNPYYSSPGFPKNSSGYQAIDPKIQSTNSNSNNSLSSPMSFQFPTIKTLPPNTTLKCVGQVSADQWSADVCKSVQKDGQVVCQCNTLNPTSIMESLDYILDKAEQIFSMDALAAFLTFPFYKAVIFYFYLTITISYLYIIYWGLKADNLMFEKIQVEKELEEQKKLLEEKEQADMEQNKQLSNQSSDNIENIPNPVTVFSKNKLYPEDQVQLNIKTNKSINISSNLLRVKYDTKQENNQQQQDQLSQNKVNLQEQQDVAELDLNQNQTERQNSVKETKKPTLVFPEFLKYFHQILSIVYKDDEKKPRGLRATIIYTSIMGSLVVLFVFNQPNNLSLTMTLALITAPLNKIYQVLLEKLLSHNKKIVRVVGSGVMIVFAGFISYTMLAGLALNGDIEASNKWSFIFLGSLTLDNVLYSPIQLIVQYNIHIGRINIPIIQQLLHKLLDESAKKYVQQIIEKIK